MSNFVSNLPKTSYMSAFIHILLFFKLLLISFSNIKPNYYDLEAVGSSKKDHKYRKNLERIKRQDPYSFYTFLDFYMEEESDLNRFKIMQGYYEKAAREPYNLISLMLMFNAWNPNSRQSNTELFKFLNEHFHEDLVLALFFYRCLPLTQKQIGFTFTQISEKVFGLQKDSKAFLGRKGLYPRRPSSNYIVFNELEGLHFLDTMLQAEISENSFLRIRDLLYNLWLRHKLLQTSLYRKNYQWFDRVISFYASRNIKEPLQNYFKTREKLFCNANFCNKKPITDLENILKIPVLDNLLPNFLNKNIPIDTKTTKL